MLHFNEIKKRYGHALANVVTGSLEELQTNGLEITSHISKLAVNYYQDNVNLIENMDSLSQKRRYITQFIMEGKQ